MTVNGPPFYDENEWEPDEPTLKELLGGLAIVNGRVSIEPWQLQVIQQYYMQMFGRNWQSAVRAFLEGLVPVVNKFHEMARCAEPLVAATRHIPPSNGPKYNPHARHGKGGRRR